MEVAIIGAGPAGCATAIQLKRYGIDPVVLEKGKIGGLLLNANLVQNYPGFPEGITGVELASLFEEHLVRSKIKVKNARVAELNYEDNSTESCGTFLIKTAQESFRYRTVVVASGTRPKELTRLRIPKQVKNRVFYEIYPILENCRKRMAIVGSGDAAFDYALNLAKRSNQVIILNRSMRRKCAPSLWQDVMREKRILYEDNVEITSLSGSGDKLFVECKKTSDSNLRIFIDYLIIAIGRVPETDYISQEMKKNIPKLQRSQRLYFVGDVKRGICRQATIAVGDGIHAAMRIRNLLRKEAECES